MADAMFTAIAAFFCFLLAPTNLMSYDTDDTLMRQRPRSQDWAARRSRFAHCRCCLGVAGPSAAQSHFTGSPAAATGKFPRHRRAGGRVYSRLPSCRARPRRCSARSFWRRWRSVARLPACGTFVGASILARALMKRLRLWREATARRRSPNLPILMTRSRLDRAQPFYRRVPGCS